MFKLMSYYKYFAFPKIPRVLRGRTEITVVGLVVMMLGLIVMVMVVGNRKVWTSHFSQFYLQPKFELTIQFPFLFYKIIF